jgi:hypothetical protein
MHGKAGLARLLQISLCAQYSNQTLAVHLIDFILFPVEGDAACSVHFQHLASRLQARLGFPLLNTTA